MFGFLKKKSKVKIPPQLLDIEGKLIQEGDEVVAHRYDLGKCVVELDELQYFYRSLDSDKRISYTKMIDAITGNQKVKKMG